jgi:ankyrin repeat protein
MPYHCRSFAVWLPALLTVSGIAVAAADRQPLLEAARKTDRAAVRQLLNRGARVDAAEGDGTTALHWASDRDDLATADLLIRAGANVNAANDLGATALWAASVNGSAAMVGRLLQAGADPNRALPSGETALMAACRSGSAAAVEKLLAKGARVNVRATRGQTALMWAAAQKHPEVVELLIAHAADVHTRSDTWSQVMAVSPHGLPQYNRTIPHGGDTALMFAVRAGDLDSATLLVAAGANVNDTDAGGVSATALAAHAGFRDVVEFLLEQGADANLGGAGFTALHAAIMRRDRLMAVALVAHGADVNAPVSQWTPTRRSSRDWNFNPELVGATPFWLAARMSAPDIMQLLAVHGADPRAVHHVEYHAGDPVEPRTQTTTALMAAAGMGGGVAWVPIDRAEREPLALAAVKVAVELGIDVNAANDDGRTALDAAQGLKYEAVARFLVEHGGRPGAGATRGAPSGGGR